MGREMFEVDIIYQDSAIVVVNKPAGLLSVPGRGPDKQDSIVKRIRHFRILKSERGHPLKGESRERIPLH